MSTPAEPRKDYFVSYNRADRGWAEWIAWQLEESHYTTVLQAWDFRPGTNWVLEMDRAAAQAERTIAVLSPEYLTSLYTRAEWAAAFAHDPTGQDRRLVPVRVRECTLTGLLAQLVYLDLVELDEASARTALLQALNPGRPKPEPPPIYPGLPSRTVPDRPRFPGALPAMWNMPYQRNPNFSGREALLAEVRRSFSSTQHEVGLHALTGLGGVGKTLLSVEYAHRYAPDYELVWWIRAEDVATLAADYAALATGLRIVPPDVSEQAVLVDAVRGWLRQHRDWLLIFDNAREPAEVRPFLPVGGAGHVLITSRNPAWSGLARTLAVPVLPRMEATEFLLKRTRQSDRPAAQALAEILGDLPLALEQAGAYMDATGQGMMGYIGLFQKYHFKLLMSNQSRPATEYPNTVATTWELAFEQVQATSPAAIDLLALCAFLAPEAIPIRLIREGSEQLPPGSAVAAAVVDDLLWDDAIAALRRYSLLETGSGGLTVHRLVQALEREDLGEPGCRIWAEAAARLLTEAFEYDGDDVRTWPTCARLLPHALGAAGYAEELHVAGGATGHLLNQVGSYLRDQGDLQGARQAFERALRISETDFSAEYPDAAIIANKLGGVLRVLGDVAGARAYRERALRTAEATYGPNDKRVGIVLKALGRVLYDEGNLDEARALYERALQIQEAACGRDDPEVAGGLTDLGEVLRAQGKLEEARALQERALRVMQAAFGPDHRAVAGVHNNFGALLQTQGDLLGAREHFERALSIFEVVLGPDQIDTARSLLKLGEVLHDQGDSSGARVVLERSLAIFEVRLGPNHASTVGVREHLHVTGT